MSERVRVPIVRLRGASGSLPRYMSAGSSGLDLEASIAEDVTLLPGARVLVPSGVAIALPDGFEGQVRPRSGLAQRAGVTVLNAPGTIDSDYRGEIQVLLVNLGAEAVVVRPGDRVAQLVVAPVCRVAWEECERLDATVRGAGGYGSTGDR